MRILLFLAMFFVLSRAEAANPVYDLLAKGGAGGWVNTVRPIGENDLKGRAVLLDFWTYGCINCMQIIPDLDYLEKKFPQLVVIGVHSAKYKGEGLSDRIRAAAERFRIHHPVMNDSDFAVWNAFGVNAWPTLILLDGEGKEISRYSGEGHRADLERDISEQKGLVIPGMTVGNLLMKPVDGGVLSFPSHLTFAEKTPWGPVFFVGDTGHNRIVAFARDGTVKAVIGSGEAALKDGDFKTAAFDHPRGTALVGNILYVADTNNHALRGVDLQSGKVTTLAGNGRRGLPRLFGFGIGDPELASPWDVELMEDGKRLAIAMAGMHQLWFYDIADKTADVLAGSARESISDGLAMTADFAQPSGLSRSGKTLYFVDAETSSLRKLEDGKVETLVGTGLFDFGMKDGKYPDALMQHAQGVFADGNTVYVADTYNNALRKYDASTHRLSTVKLDGGDLIEPGDVYVQDGKAYIADTGQHRIAVVDLATGKISALPLAH